MIKRVLSFFLLSALILLPILNSCSKDDSYCQSQAKNMAGEYESLIKYIQEKRWNQMSLAIANSVAKEIILGKKSDIMQIALAIDHFLSSEEMTAIIVKIKESHDFEPFIAIWNESSRIRKAGKDAVIPESLIRDSLKSAVTVKISGNGTPIEIESIVYYNTLAIERQMRTIQKTYSRP